MVYLEEYFLPGATTLGEGGVIWGWASLHLVILVHSSCFLGATILASYEVNLCGPVFMWLLITLSGTSAAGPDRWVCRAVSESLHL